jgi:hypothetical protein
MELVDAAKQVVVFAMALPVSANLAAGFQETRSLTARYLLPALAAYNS